MATFTIEVDDAGEGEFISHIRSNDSIGLMWSSFPCPSESEALRRAAQLIADMHVDFLHAAKNDNVMDKNHPKVAAARKGRRND